MKKWIGFGVAAIALIAIALVLYGAFSYSTVKTGYITSSVVFNEFPLKKELDKKFMSSETARQSALDSMALQLQLLASNLKNSKDAKRIQEFNIQKAIYLDRQAEFEELIRQETEAYTQQVWQQVNQYVKDFGELHGYDYIYGADGSGTLMYASSGLDITEDVTKYLAERYEGK